MTTATATTLYISNKGEVACPDHGGTYLRLAHEHNPTALEHTTPLESWDRMTTDYIVEWVDAFGSAPKCGRCA